MKKFKQKTRKGAAKRFKVTASGKVMRRAQNTRHIRRRKSKKAIRSYRIPRALGTAMALKVKRMLGLA